MNIHIGDTVTIQRPDDAYSGLAGVVVYESRYSMNRRYFDVRMTIDSTLRKYIASDLNKMDAP